MKRYLPVICATGVALGAFSWTLAGAAPARPHPQAARSSLAADYLRSPLGFIAQRGPRGHPELIARGSGYSLAITAASATLGLTGKGHHARVQMRLLGADARANARTSQLQPGRVNELLAPTALAGAPGCARTRAPVSAASGPGSTRPTTATSSAWRTTSTSPPAPTPDGSRSASPASARYGSTRPAISSSRPPPGRSPSFAPAPTRRLPGAA